jgi:hypothetical protein
LAFSPAAYWFRDLLNARLDQITAVTFGDRARSNLAGGVSQRSGMNPVSSRGGDCCCSPAWICQHRNRASNSRNGIRSPPLIWEL